MQCVLVAPLKLESYFLFYEKKNYKLPFDSSKNSYRFHFKWNVENWILKNYEKYFLKNKDLETFTSFENLKRYDVFQFANFGGRYLQYKREEKFEWA